MKLVILFAQNLHLPSGLRIQIGLMRLQVGKELPLLRICRQIILCLGQNLYSFSSSLPAPGGSSRSSIQLQYAQGMLISRARQLPALQQFSSLIQ